MMKAGRSVLYVIQTGILGITGSVALEMPADVRTAFQQSSTTEDGSLYNTEGRKTVVTDHVKQHWRELVDQLAEVPSEAGTTRSAAMLVGLAAEELPPADYLDFLDHYLTAYSKGIIPPEVLGLQLSGRNRKSYFLDVNSSDPRVQALLKRAKELAPEKAELIDDIASGANADMYYANSSEDRPPPETLSGIKLRRPFESMDAQFNREKRQQKEASRRPVKTGETPSLNDEGNSTASSMPGAALGIALLAAGAAFWAYFAKYRKLR